MSTHIEMHSELKLQLSDYRLTTAEILYRMPDHPDILQSFIWQEYDIAPKYPVLHQFLGFWVREIEGPLHSVYVASKKLITASEFKNHDGEYLIH